MLEQVEEQNTARARRIWIFDRGLVSEANLQKLRERGGAVCGGPHRGINWSSMRKSCWKAPGRKINESVQVQLITREQETYVLARQPGTGQKRKKGDALASVARIDCAS